MPTTISEEIVTFFRSDVTGFTRGAEKVQDTIKRTAAAERDAARESQRTADARKRLGETITSSIANPAAGASRAAEGLLSKLKGLGPVGIAAAVALGAAGKVMRDIRRDAEASAERIAALNDEFRKTTNSNTFASTGEGTGGLLARLRESESASRKVVFDDL